jgi:hypothetical protein
VDDTDRATEREEKYRDLALAAARNVPTLPTTGRCHWCDASVPGEAHFCDSDCRDMYDNAKRMERINGKR